MTDNQTTELEANDGTFQYSSEIDLQEMVNEQARKVQRRVDEATLDKVADTLADFGYVKVNGNSRWLELFGTPERAAKTLSRMCQGIKTCATCPLFGAGLNHCKNDYTDFASIAKWLSGEDA